MTAFSEKYGPWGLVTGVAMGLGAEFARQPEAHVVFGQENVGQSIPRGRFGLFQPQQGRQHEAGRDRVADPARELRRAYLLAQRGDL